MTISPAPHFAFLPKTCSDCGRVFIFEPYWTRTELKGIEQWPVKVVYCNECYKRRRDAKMASDPYYVFKEGKEGWK